MDVTGTSDEPAEEAGRRQMVIRVTGERLTIEASDPVIVEAGRAALRALGDKADPFGGIPGDLAECASLSAVWQALQDSLQAIARRGASPAEPPDGPGQPGRSVRPPRGVRRAARTTCCRPPWHDAVRAGDPGAGRRRTLPRPSPSSAGRRRRLVSSDDASSEDAALCPPRIRGGSARSARTKPAIRSLPSPSALRPTGDGRQGLPRGLSATTGHRTRRHLDGSPGTRGARWARAAQADRAGEVPQTAHRCSIAAGPRAIGSRWARVRPGVRRRGRRRRGRADGSSALRNAGRSGVRRVRRAAAGWRSGARPTMTPVWPA